MTRNIDKPADGEFNPYAITYISLLPDDGRVLNHLKENGSLIRSFIMQLSEQKLVHRYAEGKWTVKEILVHIMDDERIYAYRALRIGRNDKTPLPGFEQDDYVPFSRANDRTLEDIFSEYMSVRNATISLFNSFSDEDLVRTGTANDHTVSVRALAYHIAGHELHHLNIIRERYR
jgi:uncharacterized damage-inducible protein DinB